MDAGGCSDSDSCFVSVATVAVATVALGIVIEKIGTELGGLALTGGVLIKISPDWGKLISMVCALK